MDLTCEFEKSRSELEISAYLTDENGVPFENVGRSKRENGIWPTFQSKNCTNVQFFRSTTLCFRLLTLNYRSNQGKSRVLTDNLENDTFEVGHINVIPGNLTDFSKTDTLKSVWQQGSIKSDRHLRLPSEKAGKGRGPGTGEGGFLLHSLASPSPEKT